MAAKKENKKVADAKAETEKKSAKKSQKEETAAESRTEESKATVKGVRKESQKAAAPVTKPRPLPRPVEKTTLDLDEETRRLLAARKMNKASLPEFRRIDSHKKAKLDAAWRWPRGHHSQLRRQRKSKGAIVKAGYGSPAAVNGFHPSGYQEVLVYRPEDVKDIAKTQAIRIARTVGKKKQMEIERIAKEMNVKVLNPLNVFEEAQ